MTSSTPAPKPTTDVAASVRKAPELPPWPKSLPDARRTPLSARCVDLEGSDLGQGVWVPQSRADATEDLIRACRKLPRLCQSQLDRTWDTIMPAAIEGAVGAAVKKAELEHLQEERDQAGGYSLGRVLLVGVGSGVVGALIGALIVALGR